jgi:hypothetical protein
MRTAKDTGLRSAVSPWPVTDTRSCIGQLRRLPATRQGYEGLTRPGCIQHFSIVLTRAVLFQLGWL